VTPTLPERPVSHIPDFTGQPRPPQFVLPPWEPSERDKHWAAGRERLAQFEASGDWRAGLAAVIHALLALDTRTAEER
jgi:hypothetical protein